jgi:hypothetical protein
VSTLPCEVCEEETLDGSSIVCQACLAMARGVWKRIGSTAHRDEEMVLEAMGAAVGMLDGDRLRTLTMSDIQRMACAAVAVIGAKR